MELVVLHQLTAGLDLKLAGKLAFVYLTIAHSSIAILDKVHQLCGCLKMSQKLPEHLTVDTVKLILIINKTDIDIAQSGGLQSPQ